MDDTKPNPEPTAGAEPADEPGVDSEFDAAFQSFSEAKTTAAAPEPPAASAADGEGEPAADVRKPAEPAAAPASTAQSKDTAKAAAPAAAPTPAPAAKPAAAQDPFDGASLTAEQRAYLDRVRQENSSHRGRARGDQDKIADLTRRLEAAAGKAPAAAKAAPIQPKALLDGPKFKKLKDEFPEIYEPISEVIGALAEENARLAGTVEGISATAETAGLNDNMAALLDEHPDALDLTRTDEFDAWVVTQPRYIRDAVARNANAVTDPQEAADIVQRFKDFKATANAEPAAANTAAPTPAPAATPNKAAARRQAAVRTATVAPAKAGAPAPGGAPGDFEGSFGYFAAKKAPQRVAAR